MDPVVRDFFNNLNFTLQRLLVETQNNNNLLRDIVSNTDENLNTLDSIKARTTKATVFEKGQKISMVIEINFNTHANGTANYLNFTTTLSAANNFNTNIRETYDVYLDSFTTMGAIPSSLVDRRTFNDISHYKGFIVEFTSFLNNPISSTVTNTGSGMDNDDGGKIYIPNEHVSPVHYAKVSSSAGLSTEGDLVSSIDQNPTDATNGTHTSLSTTTDGGGTGAELEILVEGNTVTSVIVITEGSGYEAGDTVTVSGSDIPNAGDNTDLEIILETGDINLNTITLTSANSSLRPGMIVAGMGKLTSDHGTDNEITDTSDDSIEYGSVWIKSIDGSTITLNTNVKVGINAEIGFYDVDQSKIHRGKKLNFLFRLPEVNFNNIDNLTITGSISSLSGNTAFKQDHSSGFVMDLILIPVEFKSSNN